uniref:Integrase zinc-binding domain-containing protein n=1 Tax=Cacopsylla melanoneura TaxID=428564 RepID=A0A8D8WD99_9HEMI
MGPPPLLTLHQQKLKKNEGLRDKYFKSLQTTYKLIGSSSEQSQFLVRASRINETYASFEHLEEELIQCNSECLEEEDKVKLLSEEGEAFYVAIIAHHKDIVSPPPPPPPVSASIVSAPPPPVSASIQPTVNCSVSEPEHRPNIPKINIEPFHGAFENFSSFKSLFDTLIHKTKLTNIEKFSYLISLLRGKALQTIKTIEFNEVNYQKAYDKLVAEFSNPRLVATHYLNKILSVKPASFENPATLRFFLDQYNTDVESLHDLHLESLTDFVFLHIALKNLPVETRRLFECDQSDQMPTLQKLMLFLKKRLNVLEMSPDVRKPSSAMPHSFLSTMSDRKPPPSKSFDQNHQKLSTICPVCKQNHRIHQCPMFIDMSVSDRQNAVANAKLCFACLGPHPRSQCQSTYTCRTCHDRNHHSMLHKPNIRGNPSMTKSNADPPSTSLACHQSSANTVLLGTAIAEVQCSSGFWHKARIVIDPGSMVSFITSSLAQTLNLPLVPTPRLVTGLGHTPVQTSQMCVNFKLSPVNVPHLPSLSVDATVLSNISAEIPHKPIPVHVAEKFKNMCLADYSIFQSPAKVDILLGAAHLSQILLPGQAIIPGQPSCWPTIFGHVLIGEVPDTDVSPTYQSLFVDAQNDVLRSQLQQFWEAEEITPRKFSSPDDMACEKNFEETHYRNEEGQFVVRLPFKSNPSEIGSTRETALRQFYSLERKLDKDVETKEMYHANIQGYFDQNQIEIAKSPSPIVLPHHAVIRQSSSSPLRVVFNASQPSNNSKTLNSAMHIGPKLQHDVGDIILLFRLHAVALCADIRQMYRAIIIHPDDRQFQHIFWRFNKDEPVQEWELKRLTFGFTPASYLAQKCLHTLAITEKEKFPTACQALLNSCYVDDIVTGAESVEAAQQLRQDLVCLLQSGGFELKKFSSSSPTVLSDVPLEDQESLHLHDDNSIKVLGLHWDPTHDHFHYTIKIQPQKNITKRTLLSHVASIFDINGYLTHLVIFLKILLQKIWITKGDWDDQLPPELLSQWNEFVRELPCLTDLVIPRYISHTQAMTYQLIAFSDASSAAMSCTIYLRISCADGTILVHLLRAKSKVAPLKTVSIPRLELNAAYLLVKMIKSLDHFTKSLKIETIQCFSDSTTTLAWIQTPPYLLKTYVANRVATIVETIAPSHWRYVPTSMNPADLATRGLLPSQVMHHHDFWFHGPEFLYQDPSTWPTLPSLPATEKLPELKPNITLVSQEKPVPDMIKLIEKYSSLMKLQRVIAWMFRFVNNCHKKREDRVFGFLSPIEIASAMSACVSATQKFYFPDEIKILKQEKPYLGSLKNLSPFLNPSSGILMVGGRLRNAPLPVDSKHPMLLPAKSHLAKLLVNYLHIYSLHGGARLIQSLLQRQYWIVGARNLIKQCVFSCLKCYKLSATVRPPYMGDIPISRFTQGRCFINVAIDFAGPYLLKSEPRRNSPIVKY